MSLDRRHVRLYGAAFRLHDVRDVEAHVRTLLDAYLRERGARLDAAKYNDALAYLVALCWTLSGLQADGRTARIEVFAQLLILDKPQPQREQNLQELGPFPTRARAEDAVQQWTTTHVPQLVVAVEYVERAPRGSYDPRHGLAFSTYSRRILSRRVVDWYRSTFGDSRYGTHTKPLSLDALVDQWENHNDGSGADASYLDQRGPGSVDSFVDLLNTHAYYDPFEERDAINHRPSRQTTDLGGTDRVAAAR